MKNLFPEYQGSRSFPLYIGGTGKPGKGTKTRFQKTDQTGKNGKVLICYLSSITYTTTCAQKIFRDKTGAGKIVPFLPLFKNGKHLTRGPVINLFSYPYHGIPSN